MRCAAQMLNGVSLDEVGDCLESSFCPFWMDKGRRRVSPCLLVDLIQFQADACYNAGEVTVIFEDMLSVDVTGEVTDGKEV